MEHMLRFPQLITTLNHILENTTYFSDRKTVDVRALGATDDTATTRPRGSAEVWEAVVWETNVRHSLRQQVFSLLDACLEKHGVPIMGPAILARLRCLAWSV